MPKASRVLPPLSDDQLARFMVRVDSTATDPLSCWPWIGATNGRYGLFSVGTAKFLAHRVAFCLHHGCPYADAPVVMHDCDNPLCCRPSHLTKGTMAKNQRDMALRHRSARGSRHGRSKLTEGDAAFAKGLLALGFQKKQIGAVMSVSGSAISMIASGDHWGDIEPFEVTLDALTHCTRPIGRGSAWLASSS